MWLVKEILLSTLCYAGTYIKTPGKGKDLKIAPWGTAETDIGAEKTAIPDFDFFGITTNVVWFTYRNTFKNNSNYKVDVFYGF